MTTPNRSAIGRHAEALNWLHLNITSVLECSEIIRPVMPFFESFVLIPEARVISPEGAERFIDALCVVTLVPSNRVGPSPSGRGLTLRHDPQAGRHERFAVIIEIKTDRDDASLDETLRQVRRYQDMMVLPQNMDKYELTLISKAAIIVTENFGHYFDQLLPESDIFICHPRNIERLCRD